MVTTAQTSRMTVGSTSICSPSPPQTPPSIRSFRERYNRFMYRKWPCEDKEFAPSLPVPGAFSYRKVKVSTGYCMTGSGNEVKTATFGAGCFWGVEAAFRRVKGVTATVAGYMGGSVKDPTYEQVCSGATGHAEVVQVTYDPAQVAYDELLAVFWSIHNPTQLNRQGPDVGSNYRSVIFYHDGDQARAARRSKDDLQVSGRLGFGKIVTVIQPATEFWRAEEYHQQYFDRHGDHGSCGI